MLLPGFVFATVANAVVKSRAATVRQLSIFDAKHVSTMQTHTRNAQQGTSANERQEVADFHLCLEDCMHKVVQHNRNPSTVHTSN